MDQFKLDDGTMCSLLCIYQNLILYTKAHDNNFYAARYEIKDNKIALNEVSDAELDIIIRRYNEAGKRYDKE